MAPVCTSTVGPLQTATPIPSRGYAPGVPKTVREAEKLLRKNGWTLARTVGSHRQYVHALNPNVVTIPGAPGKQIATGTLASIRRASGIDKMR